MGVSGKRHDVIGLGVSTLDLFVTGLDVRGCAALAGAVAAMNTRQVGGRGALPTFAEAARFTAESGRLAG